MSCTWLESCTFVVGSLDTSPSLDDCYSFRTRLSSNQSPAKHAGGSCGCMKSSSIPNHLAFQPQQTAVNRMVKPPGKTWNSRMHFYGNCSCLYSRRCAYTCVCDVESAVLSEANQGVRLSKQSLLGYAASGRSITLQYTEVGAFPEIRALPNL